MYNPQGFPYGKPRGKPYGKPYGKNLGHRGFTSSYLQNMALILTKFKQASNELHLQ